MNGGSCSDDHCLCQKGYTGTHCGQRKYTFIYVGTLYSEVIPGCMDRVPFTTKFQLMLSLFLIRCSGILQENS